MYNKVNLHSGGIMTYYLAIDIGASSGRHILGHIENGLLITEEIHRFENGVKKNRIRLSLGYRASCK